MNIQKDTTNMMLAIAGCQRGPATITTRSPTVFEHQIIDDAMTAYFSQDDPERLLQPCGTLSGIETVDGEDVLVRRNANQALRAFQILPDGRLGEQVDAPLDEDEQGGDEDLDDPGPEDDDIDDFGGEPEDDGVGEDHAIQ